MQRGENHRVERKSSFVVVLGPETLLSEEHGGFRQEG